MRSIFSSDIHSIENDINYIVNVSNSGLYYIDISNVQFEDGKYIDSYGNISNSGAAKLSDYIELQDTYRHPRSLLLNRIIYNITNNGTIDKYHRSRMAWFYDEDKNIINVHKYNLPTNNIIEEFVPIKAKYVRVNIAKYVVPTFIGVTTYNNLTGMSSEIQETGIDDVNELPANSIYLRSNGNSTDQIAKHIPYNTFTGQIITTNCYNYNRPGTFQIAISSNNELYVRRSWTANNVWNNWTKFARMQEECKLIFSSTCTFTSAKQTINTNLALPADTEYDIVITGHTGDIHVYGMGDTNNFKKIPAYNNEITFSMRDVTRYLLLYNYSGTLDTIKLNVYLAEKSYIRSENRVKTYIVSKNRPSTAHYSSLTQCLLDLKDDVSEKIIEIYGGDYDLYQEYTDAGVPIYGGDNPTMDYFNYCVWVPKNTHIIGKGIVRLNWMPDPEEHPEMTVNQCCCVSPLNVHATCTIENVEVHCKNGRYCLHNDALGYGSYSGAIQTYKNVKFYKYVNDTDQNGNNYGFGQTTGFGIDANMQHIYENCTFVNYNTGRAFYGHSRGSVEGTSIKEYASSNIVLNNCIIDTAGAIAVKFGNGVSTNLHIRVNFNNCYINNRVNIVDESNNGGDCHNAYDITFLNCNDLEVHIGDQDNRYPVKAYGTSITEV